MLLRILCATFFLLFIFVKMLQFLKDSVREFKHVVWPTHAETKKYLFTVLVILVLFGIYLFFASTVFSEILYGLKDVVNPSEQQTINIQDVVTQDVEVEATTGEETVETQQEADTQAQ